MGLKFREDLYLRGTLGTRGFSRVRREFSVLAKGRHVFGRRPKARAAKFRAGHYKDLTETGNRARKVSGTQGIYGASISRIFFFTIVKNAKLKTVELEL